MLATGPANAQMLALQPPGDVNFFLNDHDEPHTAEIEVMVAEPRRCCKQLRLCYDLCAICVPDAFVSCCLAAGARVWQKKL